MEKLFIYSVVFILIWYYMVSVCVGVLAEWLTRSMQTLEILNLLSHSKRDSADLSVAERKSNKCVSQSRDSTEQSFFKTHFIQQCHSHHRYFSVPAIVYGLSQCFSFIITCIQAYWHEAAAWTRNLDIEEHGGGLLPPTWEDGNKDRMPPTQYNIWSLPLAAVILDFKSVFFSLQSLFLLPSLCVLFWDEIILIPFWYFVTPFLIRFYIWPFYNWTNLN